MLHVGTIQARHVYLPVNIIFQCVSTGTLKEIFEMIIASASADLRIFKRYGANESRPI